MRIAKIAVTLLVTMLSGITLAGTLVKFPVEINNESRIAWGSMTSARFSSNEFEAIGCGIRMHRDNRGGKYDLGFCSASTTEDDLTMCTTENVELIETIRGMNDFSYVVFTWNADGECSLIGSSTRSQYITGKLK